MKAFAFFLLVSLFACTQPGDPATAKQEANIRAAYEALNQRDFDAFAALCAENYTDVNVAPTPTVGVQNAIELYKQFTTGFPDFKLNITDIAPAGNNRYLLRIDITGTHTSTFMGIPPTGKAIKFTDSDVVELNAEGKCVSHSITNNGEPLVQIGYASMLNPAAQTVMAAYEKFGKGDIEGVLALCDDKAVFDINERGFDSKARMFSGKAELGQFFQEVGAKFKYAKFQPTRFVADGDDVFVLIDVEYNYVPSGKNYTSTLTHYFKVADGKITFARTLDDFQKQK
ncbi:MAG: nuclear transport factor 2 family protein [Bacteroidetes bacterium]|nr:nuclear transport factor 2 family protein [Bacteroidota bacterium]